MTGNRKTKYIILFIMTGLCCIGCLIWLMIYVSDLRHAQREVDEMMEFYVTHGTPRPVPQKEDVAEPPALPAMTA